MEHHRDFGRWLEDIVIGDVYHHGPGRTIAEFDNVWSSLLCMDTSGIWVDRHMAERLGHPACPVNPMLIWGLAVSMSIPDVSGKGIGNLGYDDLKVHKTVYPGVTIYSRSTVLEVRASRTRPDRGPVYVLTEAIDQDDEVVLSVKRRTMVMARPVSANQRETPDA